MAIFYYPIEVMMLRDQQLQSSHSATFGLVRNNQTTNHQGWDLFAPAGTRCYAIASGHVEWVRNQGAYGQQLALSFSRDGSNRTSNYPLIAFYATCFPAAFRCNQGHLSALANTSHKRVPVATQVLMHRTSISNSGRRTPRPRVRD